MFGNFREYEIFIKNLTRMASTLHEDQRTFMVISRQILLKLRSISDKPWTENQNIFYVQ